MRCLWTISRLKHYGFPRRSLTQADLRCYVTKVQLNENEEVIKYSQSAASRWKAEYSRIGTDDPDEITLGQTVFRFFATALFLLYWYFREPNDIDENLSMSLPQRLIMLKEESLREEKMDLLSRGETTLGVDEELLELEELKKSLKIS